MRNPIVLALLASLAGACGRSSDTDNGATGSTTADGTATASNSVAPTTTLPGSGVGPGGSTTTPGATNDGTAPGATGTGQGGATGGTGGTGANGGTGATDGTGATGTTTTGDTTATGDTGGGDDTGATATSDGTGTAGETSTSDTDTADTSGPAMTDGSDTSTDAGSETTTDTDDRDAHFKDWPATAEPSSVGLKLAELFDSQAADTTKHYKEACTWYGSLAMAALLGNQGLVDSLIARYAPFAGTYGELLAGEGHVDENVFGIVPLEISLHSEDAAYLTEGLAIADHQRANMTPQIRYAIDDMFMITALQVQAYRASGDAVYLDAAADTMVLYLDRLQQDDGLFHHHEDFHHKWARGNGWFAAGMAELIRELPESHTHQAKIKAGYEAMMNGLLGYQIKSGEGAGLWKQIVDSDDTDNWAETSGSAMFTYALVSGVRRGWLDVDTYGPAARNAWIALVGKLTANGQLQDVSNWAYKPESHPEFGDKYDNDEEQYYFDRERLTGDNHGQAPMLWTAAALTR